MEKPDNAGVRVPPPLYFLSFLIIGIWQSSTWIRGEIGSPILLVLGGVIAVVGAVFLLKFVRKHESSGTNVEPWKPTTALIIDGPHRYSRNPIYVAMAVVYLGIAIAASSLVAIVYSSFASC